MTVFWLGSVSILCKILLLPSYRSTDFEVHRNWLAITYSKPLSEWYFESASHSPWTLDYPPFFAYFEYLLAQLAHSFDPRIVNTLNLNDESFSTLLFQRCTVIATDILFLFTAWKLIQKFALTRQQSLITFALAAFSPCFLIVDHIHFQYNGYLLSFLLLALYYAHTQSFLLCASFFSILVLSKHIFFPLAPLFAVYLLRSYCRLQISLSKFSIDIPRFAAVILTALFFLSIALLPFLLQSNPIEQMQAIFSRLFPFQRGLVHSYWAPNVWALYTATDYLLYLVLSSQRLIPKASVTPAYLSGLVGDHAFMLLPRISPLISLLLVLSTLLPAVTTIYRSPSSRVLQQAVLYAALSVFMVGYHVHEKAILPVYLLATLHTFLSPSHTQFMAILATPAITCLFPLLFHPTELVTKTMIAIVYFSALWCFVICEFSASFKRF